MDWKFKPLEYSFNNSPIYLSSIIYIKWNANFAELGLNGVPEKSSFQCRAGRFDLMTSRMFYPSSTWTFTTRFCFSPLGFLRFITAFKSSSQALCFYDDHFEMFPSLFQVDPVRVFAFMPGSICPKAFGKKGKKERRPWFQSYCMRPDMFMS